MYPFETYNKFDTTKYLAMLIVISIFLFSNTLFAFPPDSVDVKADHYEIKSNAIYEIHFSIEKEIPSTASIIVKFPDGFDLSGVLIASSTTMNGGFQISKEKNDVILKRSGLGKTIPAREKVDVKFANVRNPELAADNYKVNVIIKNEQQKTIFETEKNINIVTLDKK